jgi:hemoglobin-like flavoprotein
MTEQHVSLVRLSWASLFAREEEFAQRCYDELFAREPRLRILFQGFMDEQHRRLSIAISGLIDRLEDQERLTAELRHMGARHKGYGVKSEHHAPVAAAIMTALDSMLGPDFTPPVREAWLAFYGFVAKGMAMDEPLVAEGQEE